MHDDATCYAGMLFVADAWSQARARRDEGWKNVKHVTEATKSAVLELLDKDDQENGHEP